MAANNNKTRASRLYKALFSFVKGRRPVSSQHDAQLFFEAVQDQSSPSACLENLVGNSSGLDCVRNGVRVNTAADFICNRILPFLTYFSHPDCKAICDGQLLRHFILAVVDPPTTWEALLKAYLNNELSDSQGNVETFAWLCLEVVNYPGPTLTAITRDLGTQLDAKPLIKDRNHKVRELGYQVQKVLAIKSSATASNILSQGETPGGRHDNDHADFRDISIYPTTDEFCSTLPPFYRRAATVASIETSKRAGVHLDNQFRLLREDMLAELRDDIKVATGKRKRRRPAQILQNMWPIEIYNGNSNRSHLCSLDVQIGSGLNMLQGKTLEQRKAYLRDNRNVLGNQAFGALCCENNVIAFAYVVRDVDKLAGDPPVIGLRFPSSHFMSRFLANFQTLRFILVDTPIFAYEPVLERLKEITQLPMERQLLLLDDDLADGLSDDFTPTKRLKTLISDIRQDLSDGTNGLERELQIESHILDAAQSSALLYALESPLSVIQGPPGTGKSFIGALVAKILLEDANTRILVLSYTNHALDQFLEDLLKIGISRDIMVRLGAKFTLETADLSLKPQFRTYEYHRGGDSSTRLKNLKAEMESLRVEIDKAFKKMACGHVPLLEILEYLEFSEEDGAEVFWRAFQLTAEVDGFITTGGRNRKVQPDQLIQRWCQDKGPGPFKKLVPADCNSVWTMKTDQREIHYRKWIQAIQEEYIQTLQCLVDEFDDKQRQVDTLYNEAQCEFIKTKQVIGCTTTAAAKYPALLKAAKPDCVLVEEAGEILEAHVLTALNPGTKQLILIGDHKQLRPKCNNYALTVEKGDGFDLNRSLFERLILNGQHHVVLQKQHRMVPEISQLIRTLTYPDLLDDEKTYDRDQIKGIRERVVFINHEKAESEDTAVKDQHDPGYKASKQNVFEAEMVLKLVKFLGQQGYKTENIVVLTPYLGQLRLLRDMLSKENDPLLSDLDSFELIRAGLLTKAAGNVDKKHIRISTIDNYQGEESDIVIASLTRSNEKGDIGFMKAPERLNVLISRARNCLIMIGNMETFMASPQGKAVWVPLFKIMKEKGYLQDSLHIQCERHPEQKFILSEPKDFDEKCPDGGCSQPCGAQLKCGLHICERKCHRLEDHTNAPCNQLIEKICVKQHAYKVRCEENHAGCSECRKEEEDIRRRAKRDLELEKARMARRDSYRRELEKIQDEIAHEKLLLKLAQENEDQRRDLKQSRDDLAALKETNSRRDAMKQAKMTAKLASKFNTTSNSPSTSTKSSTKDIDPGSAQEEWEDLKREERASNTTLDALMGMVGLEDVKRAFLTLKGRVDTATRQCIPMESERFGCTLLGNPGTGKTTVARLYAKFLTSVGIIAGSCFEETTGSKLANMGVPGSQKLLDDMLEKGGGVLFIDEAYQLSSGNSPGGRAVLDFILAEVENLTGKICFVLAGYAKQMESFFAHNPGFPSRFPLEMQFADYTDNELLKILESKTNAKYGNRMKAEDGLRGLYFRIATSRLGRARGKEGFGNARAVENLLARISCRQSERLRKERRAKMKPDDFLFTKEDIIGPEPSNALLKSQAWNNLQQLVGLTTVKESVKSLVDTIKTNYDRELKEEPIVEYNLNKVFLGNPGTGKTTVAKIYGQILVDLGMLSNGEVIVRNPSDFVGGHLGQSEQQTKAILASTAGKVLVIDEAYGLYGGGASQGGGSADPYKTAVVDTIVAEVQSVPGDDRCVLLLGYKDQMEEMFQNVNPGLSRRFPLSSAFTFEDFDKPQLSTIFDRKLKQQGFGSTGKAKEVALEMLDRARNRPNFGNAGEIDILLNEAKSRHQKRLTQGVTKRVSTFEALDFDENFDRLEQSSTNIAQLFQDTVGCERIVAKLEGFQNTVQMTKSLGLDPKESIPFNFLFRGPPGTGKTTTARKMGKVFFDLGFLASAEVLDCSASDLIGQYVGQTGPKVRQLFDKALGRVLLIDEAYRLTDGGFAKEALDEIVDAVTKERYFKKLIVILAGYEDDINRLLNVNPGMTSRFPEVIDFHGLDSNACFSLLAKKLSIKKAEIEKPGKGTMDVSCLEHPSLAFKDIITKTFTRLRGQPSWASARDVETLARGIFQKAIQAAAGSSPTSICVSEAMVRAELEEIDAERASRAKQSSQVLKDPIASLMQSKAQTTNSSNPSAAIRSTQQAQQGNEKEEEQGDDDEGDDTEDQQPTHHHQGRKTAIRDAGVSDEVWDQLQKDAEAEEQRERDYQAKLKMKREAIDDAVRDRIVRELIEEEERRKEEEEARKKLETQGLCPAGFHWIRQEGGWRCAGGSHFVTEGALGF